MGVPPVRLSRRRLPRGLLCKEWGWPDNTNETPAPRSDEVGSYTEVSEGEDIRQIKISKQRQHHPFFLLLGRISFEYTIRCVNIIMARSALKRERLRSSLLIFRVARAN